MQKGILVLVVGSGQPGHPLDCSLTVAERRRNPDARSTISISVSAARRTRALPRRDRPNPARRIPAPKRPWRRSQGGVGGSTSSGRRSSECSRRAQRVF